MSRLTVALIHVLTLAVATSATGQDPINRDQSVPTCFRTDSCAWDQLSGSAWYGPQERVVDVSTWDPRNGIIVFATICEGNAPGNPYERSFAIDSGVNRQGAIDTANATGMFISALAPHFLNGQLVYVSLREEMPVGMEWIWIPATTQSGIQQWLDSNPDYSPYSVDSIEFNGVRELMVLAMRMAGTGNPLRTIAFDQSLTSLPAPSQSCGVRVISLAMSGPDRFDAILEQPDATDTVHRMDIVPVANQFVVNTLHAQMERVFSFAHFIDSSGQISAMALVVNNAWSLYDIHDYPQELPQPGYRGCSGSVGVPFLRITSSDVGRATPGATLFQSVTPVALDSLALMVIGRQRLDIIDLGVIGAPGCLVIPSLDIIRSMTTIGTQAQATTLVPDVNCLRGARFYLQSVIAEPTASGFAVATSNAWMVTVE